MHAWRAIPTATLPAGTSSPLLFGHTRHLALNLRSVAVMTDAAHMLSDVSAFLVSIFATWAATQVGERHMEGG